MFCSCTAVEMMEAQAQDEIFVYMGGDQRVPDGVRRARIHKDAKIILARAFQRRQRVISVEFHDDIEIIEEYAFNWCVSLKSVKLLGVKVIKAHAFFCCTGLMDVEFGEKLETIEEEAFYDCCSLRTIKMLNVRTIGRWAFRYCKQLTELDLPEGLETLGYSAFSECERLARIALPLKDGMNADDAFFSCPNLVSVNLYRGVHSTVASLHLESWRNDLTDEINRINQGLPITGRWEKPAEVQQWIGSVIRQLDYYKAQHQQILKEATTLLELALWKANLDDNGGEGGILEREGVRTTRRQLKRARKEISVTSGASIVIKNVLPFLKLLE